MWSPTKCVLGYFFGHYHTGLRELGLSRDQAMYYGFLDLHSEGEVGAAWRRFFSGRSGVGINW